MHKIVFLDRDTIAPEVILRRPSFAHEWVEYAQTGAADVAGRAADATVVITNKVKIGGETLERLPRLQLIAIAATGTDCVDVAATRARGVAVANIRGYARASVPEHTFALILALVKSLVPYRTSVLEGAWQKSGRFCFFDHPVTGLAGRRLGVIGGGGLGSRVAEIGRAFGMDVVISRRQPPAGAPEFVPFGELIATADVITLHCPLTPETRGLIGMPQFREMRKKPVIVNTARGGLIVEEDLERALDEGLVAGAGLDVTAGQRDHAAGPAPQRHRHAAHRLGLYRGAAGAGGSIDRQHREFRGRPKAAVFRSAKCSSTAGRTIQH